LKVALLKAFPSPFFPLPPFLSPFPFFFFISFPSLQPSNGTATSPDTGGTKFKTDEYAT
jgi:hypothetical protein